MTAAEITAMRKSEEGLDHIVGRLKRAVSVFLVATVFLVIGLAYMVFSVESVSNRVTAIEAYPCLASPSGEECQAVYRRILNERSRRDACIPLRTSLTPQAYEALTNCP